MELLIDIPDEVGNEIKNSGTFCYEDRFNGKTLVAYMHRAIKEGIVLPNHGRLIDADKTISEICGSSCGCHLEECGHDEPCFSVTRIKSAPTVLEANKE